MEIDGKNNLIWICKRFKPLIQINAIVYVKTEFRFGILKTYENSLHSWSCDI